MSERGDEVREKCLLGLKEDRVKRVEGTERLWNSGVRDWGEQRGGYTLATGVFELDPSPFIFEK